MVTWPHPHGHPDAISDASALKIMKRMRAMERVNWSGQSDTIGPSMGSARLKRGKAIGQIISEESDLVPFSHADLSQVVAASKELCEAREMNLESVPGDAIEDNPILRLGLVDRKEGTQLPARQAPCRLQMKSMMIIPLTKKTSNVSRWAALGAKNGPSLHHS